MAPRSSQTLRKANLADNVHFLHTLEGLCYSRDIDLEVHIRLIEERRESTCEFVTILILQTLKSITEALNGNVRRDTEYQPDFSKSS